MLINAIIRNLPSHTEMLCLLCKCVHSVSSTESSLEDPVQLSARQMPVR